MRRVLLSSDDNPLYIQFWPLVSAAWRRFGVEPLLALVTDKARAEWKWMEEYGEVVQFNTRSDIPAGNWAKVARWMVYGMHPADVGIVACIDMIPLNQEYFDYLFEKTSDADLVLASYDAYAGEPWAGDADSRKFPGNYMAASGATWQEIVNPLGLNQDDFVESWKGVSVYDSHESIDSGYDDFSEESMMRVAVHKWNPEQDRVAKLDRPGGWDVIATRRIDRAAWTWSQRELDVGYYLDCHCLRPLELYQGEIKKLATAAGLDPALVDAGIKNGKQQETK